MNASKIAALYPYFCDSLRYATAAETMVDLLVKRLQTEALPATHRYSIALTDVDNPGQHADWLAEVAGVTIQEFTDARTFDWVRQQLPATVTDYKPKPATGWHVYLQVSRRDAAEGSSLHLYTNGSTEELATVLRGLRAYQTKRRKQARRLLAQVWTYHLQQERARLAVALPAPAAVNCHDLSSEEYFRRVDAAEDLEEQLQQKHDNKARYGREIMWHPAFATECVAVVSTLPLFEATTWLAQLPQWANQGRTLDHYDYGYLADLLREGLADNPTALAALRLARMLPLIEQAGAALLPAAREMLFPVVSPLAVAA